MSSSIEHEDGLFQDHNISNKLRGIHDDERPTEIQRFYAGASVLVTGATGFMGKVLIEKLLRTCPDIDSVYMMVREKKGRSLDERIDDIISTPCFDRIRREQPGFRSKLHAVAGDIGLEGLGISEADRHLLAQQITIVFHVAATVRFDEHLKLAILQNVKGTREVLTLAKTFTKIKSLVHVSTAYSNCPTKQIDERFYKPHQPSDQLIHLAETLDITTLDHLSHKLMGEWPNTYSFTKALSEDVVRNCGYDFPIAVFRPSIVVCTESEPITGWIDNLYGPTGVIVATGAGLMRTLLVDSEAEANIVPCDMAINALITSAWDVAMNRTSAEIPVYNYVSAKTNPMNWRRYMYGYMDHAKTTPLSRAIWVPTMTLIKHKALYLLFRVFVHLLPALLMDLYLVATRRSPKMLKIYRKVHKFSMVISYFATQQWDFESKNVDSMWKRLHFRDQKLFSFDMTSLDWQRYVQDTFPSMRLFLLEDPVETVPAALLKRQRFALLHRLLKLVLIITAIWIASSIFDLRLTSSDTTLRPE